MQSKQVTMINKMIEDEFFSLPENLPFYEHEERLASFRKNTLYDRRDSRDFRTHIIECSNHLTANPFTSLLPGADSGDGEKLLDMGMRYVCLPHLKL